MPYTNQKYTYREVTQALQISIMCLKCTELMVAGHNGNYITGSEMKCPKCGCEIHLEVNTKITAIL